MTDPEDILKLLISAEYEASNLMLEAHAIVAEAKTGKRDVVTEYDRKVQELLASLITAEIPDAAFYCEENSVHDNLFAEHVFIIDPIDGTMNFVHGYNYSCISVAYASKGVITAAAVYNPYTDEMFTALKDGGAFLNSRPIRVDSNELGQCVCCFGTSPYRPELSEKTFQMIRTLYNASLDIRRSGSAELDLCSVAAGRMGLYFEESIELWDYAAGGLIVTEAGGLISTTDGNPLQLRGGTTSVLAGGPNAYKDFLELNRH